MHDEIDRIESQYQNDVARALVSYFLSKAQLEGPEGDGPTEEAESAAALVDERTRHQEQVPAFSPDRLTDRHDVTPAARPDEPDGPDWRRRAGNAGACLLWALACCGGASLCVGLAMLIGHWFPTTATFLGVYGGLLPLMVALGQLYRAANYLLWGRGMEFGCLYQFSCPRCRKPMRSVGEGEVARCPNCQALVRG
jgi:hypothetical protein